MIDYEKLKLAHELAEKLAKKTDTHVYVVSKFGFNSISSDYFDLCYGGSEPKHETFYSLSELIIKLQSLTHDKPKPKYKVGDTVWTYHADIYEWTIDSIYWEPDINDYRVNLSAIGRKASLTQSDLYPSIELLMKSRVAYWKCRLAEQTKQLKQYAPVCAPSSEECQHESDGSLYFRDTELDSMRRCVKCGEFYR